MPYVARWIALQLIPVSGDRLFHRTRVRRKQETRHMDSIRSQLKETPNLLPGGGRIDVDRNWHGHGDGHPLRRERPK